MWRMQIGGRLHLDQPRSRTLELESKLLPCIQGLDLGSRREDQLHFSVIELIDQRDKPPGLVFLLGAQYRDTGNDDGRIAARDFNIVLLTSRSVADVMEIEPDYALATALSRNLPPKNVERSPLDDIARRDFQKIMAQLGERIGSYGRQIGSCLLQKAQAIIGVPIQMQHPSVRLEHVNGRCEPFSLQAIRIEA